MAVTKELQERLDRLQTKSNCDKQVAVRDASMREIRSDLKALEKLLIDDVVRPLAVMQERLRVREVASKAWMGVLATAISGVVGALFKWVV
jgi:hypothetical protein